MNGPVIKSMLSPAELERLRATPTKPARNSNGELLKRPVIIPPKRVKP